MVLRMIISGVIAVLILSACGVQSTAQTYITAHTTCLPAEYSSPAWSPDAAWIYYTMTDPLIGLYTIRVMNTSGGSDRLLRQDAQLPMPSPDGKLLLYRSQVSTSFARPEYSLLDLATMQDRILGDLGSEPFWSPDSEWIVTSRPVSARPGKALSARSIMKTNVATGQTVTLTKPGEKQFIGDHLPLWSPGPGGTAGDGARIAFTADRDGPPAVYLFDVARGGVTRLGGQDDPTCTVNNWIAANTALAWSLDGSQLVVARACGPDSMLGVVTADGVAKAGWYYNAASIVSAGWSPDGKRILALTHRAGHYYLEVITAYGSEMKILREVVGDPPQWSPDPGGAGSGSRILFVGQGPGALLEIYTIAPDGSDVRQLTQNPGLGLVCLH